MDVHQQVILLVGVIVSLVIGASFYITRDFTIPYRKSIHGVVGGVVMLGMWMKGIPLLDAMAAVCAGTACMFTVLWLPDGLQRLEEWLKIRFPKETKQ